jgi:hypothetical protein
MSSVRSSAVATIVPVIGFAPGACVNGGAMRWPVSWLPA